MSVCTEYILSILDSVSIYWFIVVTFNWILQGLLQETNIKPQQQSNCFSSRCSIVGLKLLRLVGDLNNQPGLKKLSACNTWNPRYHEARLCSLGDKVLSRNPIGGSSLNLLPLKRAYSHLCFCNYQNFAWYGKQRNIFISPNSSISGAWGDPGAPHNDIF